MFSRAFLGYTVGRHRLRHAAAAAAAASRAGSVVRGSSPFVTCSLGVGFAPKRRRTQPQATGEDAFFYSLPSDAAGRERAWVGVLDGVGGWAESGVDPSIFARRLAHHLDAVTSTASADLGAQEALAKAYALLLEDEEVSMGSSTACVASVRVRDGRVEVANLGDSGWMVVSRKGEVVGASTAQTYFFNAPYQLAKMQASMRKPASLQNKPGDADLQRPSLADTTTPEGPSHFLVLATDGFFDNVHPHHAAAVVAHVCERPVESGGKETEAALGEEFRARAKLSYWLVRLIASLLSSNGGWAGAVMRMRGGWSNRLEKSLEPNTPPSGPGGAWEEALAYVKLADTPTQLTTEKTLARLLTAMAVRAGRDPHEASPFAEEAKKHGLRYRGGKEDDVVVAVLGLDVAGEQSSIKAKAKL
ncbi:Protein phosphatase 2C 7 [Savitreella phatthalungensis]